MDTALGWFCLFKCFSPYTNTTSPLIVHCQLRVTVYLIEDADASEVTSDYFLALKKSVEINEREN